MSSKASITPSNDQPSVQPAGIPAPQSVDLPVQGNMLTAAATGVEGLARGLTAGGSDLVGQRTGAATGSEQSARSDIESRKGAFPKTAATGEFVGESMRMAAAMALAGPAGLFVNGALNVAGESADLAYNHDPRLTREHVAHKVFGEFLTAAVTAVAGPVLGAGGKYLKKGGVALGELALENSGQAGAYVAKAGKSIEDLVVQAFDNGIFTKSRKAAEATMKVETKKVGDAMEAIVQQADQVHAAGSGVTPQQTLIEQHLADAADKLKVTRTPAALSGVSKLLKTSLSGELKPSELLRAESVVSDAIGTATAAEDGYSVGVLKQLHGDVKAANDSLLQNYGLNATGYRELQTTRLGQEAVIKSIPNKNMGSIVKGMAVGLGSDYLMSKAGVPQSIAGPASVVLGGAIGAKKVSSMASAAEAAVSASKAVGGYAAEKAYKIGAVMNDFDKGVLATWLGQQLGAQTQAAVKQVANGTLAISVKPSADKVIAFVQQYGEQPDFFHNKAAEKLHKLPLPQSYKDTADGDIQMMMGILQQAAPAKLGVPNPYAPPVSRQLTHTERHRLVERAHGLVNPVEALKNPTNDSLVAVRQAHPATYQAYIEALTSQTGPNTKATAPIRQNIERLGLDTSIRQAGGVAQVLHASQPPPPPGAKSHHSTSEHTSVKVNASQTHNEGLQSGE